MLIGTLWSRSASADAPRPRASRLVSVVGLGWPAWPCCSISAGGVGGGWCAASPLPWACHHGDGRLARISTTPGPINAVTLGPRSKLSLLASPPSPGWPWFCRWSETNALRPCLLLAGRNKIPADLYEPGAEGGSARQVLCCASPCPCQALPPRLAAVPLASSGVSILIVVLTGAACHSTESVAATPISMPCASLDSATAHRDDRMFWRAALLGRVVAVLRRLSG